MHTKNHTIISEIFIFYSSLVTVQSDKTHKKQILLVLLWFNKIHNTTFLGGVSVCLGGRGWRKVVYTQPYWTFLPCWRSSAPVRVRPTWISAEFSRPCQLWRPFGKSQNHSPLITSDLEREGPIFCIYSVYYSSHIQCTSIPRPILSDTAQLLPMESIHDIAITNLREACFTTYIL